MRLCYKIYRLLIDRTLEKVQVKPLALGVVSWLRIKRNWDRLKKLVEIFMCHFCNL